MKKRKLRICLICDVRSIHYKRWIRDLKNLGHELFIFSLWNEKDVIHKKAELIITSKISFPMLKSIKHFIKMSYRIKHSIWLRKKLKSFKPDVIHAHFITDSGWIGAWVKFHPFIITAHGSDVLLHPNILTCYRLGNIFAVKRADKIVMVANHLKDGLLKLGCTKEKLHFVPNYADDKFILSKSDLLKKFSNIGEAPKIVSARKLAPVYNVETLIKAAKQVIKNYPKAEFMIIDDGIEYQKLVDLTKELNIEKNIKFLGKVTHDELAMHLKKVHIYVSTALSDGLSVATLEGIASGAFPVLTDIPANKALFENGLNGQLFSCKDYKQLSDCILNVLNSPTDLFEICSINLKLIKENFSQNAVLNKMESIYYNTLNIFL